MDKSKILSFIKANRLAVVATTNIKGKPEAAVVEFGELDDLSIIIDTLKTSRKYDNLQHNKYVAIVIGWDKDVTVQINAAACELSDEELEVAKNAYFSKNPRAKKWADRPDVAYFVFKPEWVRYSDVAQNPWQIEEFSF